MKTDWFDDITPVDPGSTPVDRGDHKARHDHDHPGNPGDPGNSDNVLHDDRPLAAKLRELGQPIVFEVDGEPVFAIAADADGAAQSEINPCLTPDEAEVLAKFDAKGIRDIVRLKAGLGGKLEVER